MQETAPAASLYPINIGTIVALAPKSQALLQFLGPAEERDHFIGGVFDELQLRAHQFECALHVVIGVFILLKECRVTFESSAALGLAEEREKLGGTIVQRVQSTVQFARSELLGARDLRDIPRQLLELIIADADAEVPSGDILYFVRFIEDHGRVLWDDASELLVLHRQVGEEQMVVDDDDVALVRPLVHLRNEAAFELLALLAGAELASGIHFVPSRAVFGQSLDLGAVAGGGGLFPFANDLKVGDLFQARENRLAFGVVNLLPAREVVAALHVANLQRPVEMFLQERNVFVEKLLLQVLGSGGNNHALSRKDSGDQIGQGLAGTGSRVHQQMFLFGQRRFHRFGHL